MVALWAGLLLPAWAEEASVSRQPGVSVEVSGGGTKDAFILPQLSWYIEAGASPTAFLTPGPFEALCRGQVRVDLRSDILFQVESSGQVELTLRSNVVLRVGGTNGAMGLSKPVRLTKGMNEFSLRFTPPAQGPAFFRVAWGEKPFLLQPVPASQLTHVPTPETLRSYEQRAGRALFADLRCSRCHAVTLGAASMAELALDAPSFDGIGARRNADWMKRWILDPKSLRASAHMPRLLVGPEAESKASDMAAFLGSVTNDIASAALKDPPSWTHLTPEPVPGAADSKPLFESLHCAACHELPGEKASDPSKISLGHLRQKFAPGQLASFLQKPEAHYRWIRMPNFRLTSIEAQELATFLLKDLPAVTPVARSRDEKAISRGKKYIEDWGCMQCHTGGGVENRRVAVGLSELSAERWDRGCLAESTDGGGGAPVFEFTSAERSALKAFGKSDRASLSRHDPVEFAQRASQNLRCVACHGVFEGFPPLDGLGAKLQPEWMIAFLLGEIPYKPRPNRHPKGEPWLDARMPAFPAYGAKLAEGLAATHGWGKASIEVGPVDEKLAAVGRRLLGKVGGFSCVSCHGVNTLPAMEVFDSEGINLSYATRRLRREYFDRWMRLPIAVDPQTKMPAYFDEEGRSPLNEVLDGDAAKQLDAVWEYLKLGERMSMPASGDGGTSPGVP